MPSKSDRPIRCLHVGPPLYLAGGAAQCSCGMWVDFTGGLMPEHDAPKPQPKALSGPQLRVRTLPGPELLELLRRSQFADG